jgi:hypothetical protein
MNPGFSRYRSEAPQPPRRRGPMPNIPAQPFRPYPSRDPYHGPPFYPVSPSFDQYYHPMYHQQAPWSGYYRPDREYRAPHYDGYNRDDDEYENYDMGEGGVPYADASEENNGEDGPFEE